MKIRPSTRLRAGPASVDSSGTIGHFGSGAPAGQDAEVDGSGEVTPAIAGAGNAASQAAEASGSGAVAIVGSGAIEAQRAVASGSGAATGAPQTAADADFAVRAGDPNVVWAHNFEFPAEVTQFRENGDLSYDPDGVLSGGPGYVNNPNSCRWEALGGVSANGFLRIERFAGVPDSWNWYRPMSPLSSPGNGRDVDDNGGGIALDADGAWDPGPGGAHDRTPDWQAGNFGPASTGSWDGDQFYLQYKLRVSSSRDNGVFGGKVGYITRQDRTLTAQEIVPSYDWDPAKWRIYTGGSNTLRNELNSNPVPPQNEIPDHFFDEWVEYLIHVVPGDENDGATPSDPREGDSTPNFGNTRLNVFQRREGARGYTHIFAQDRVATDYSNAYLQAWNAVIFSGYFNGFNMPQSFTQDFDEAILSRAWIPPGRPAAAQDSSLETAASALSDGSFSLNPIAANPSFQTFDISWQNRTAFYDEGRQEIQFMGKAQSGGPSRHFVYDEVADSWRLTDGNVAGVFGHIWKVSFDHERGDYYYIQHRPNESPNPNLRSMMRFDHSLNGGLGDWIQTASASQDIWNPDASPNAGPVYHPNLFGPGRPGVWCYGLDVFASYDLIEDDWNIVQTGIRYISPYGGNSFNGNQQNTSLYVPGLDLALFGDGGGSSPIRVGGNPHGILIPAGSGLTQNPATYRLPISVTNDDYVGGAHMLLDPRDPTKSTVMLLERSPTGSQRVWTSNNPAVFASWTLEPFTHPYTEANFGAMREDRPGGWTVCSLPRYGCVLGMATYGDAGSGEWGTLLWRPPA